VSHSRPSEKSVLLCRFGVSEVLQRCNRNGDRQLEADGMDVPLGSLCLKSGGAVFFLVDNPTVMQLRQVSPAGRDKLSLSLD
jgi:hypothetical protein